VPAEWARCTGPQTRDWNVTSRSKWRRRDSSQVIMRMDSFRKEALALPRLTHPNIAVVYDFDIVDGVAYVAMELVPGIDVRQRILEGPLQERDVLDLGCQAASALALAHAAGIVHRDLKPENLRITPEGRLKVLDFGLAAQIAGADVSREPATVTVSRRIAGTLPYMAPEQLRGEALDQRTDVYGLCAVLFEMATACARSARTPNRC
jgi:eukaryotic-like serine/threonine-protein kinase